jgi:hypothetical protein
MSAISAGIQRWDSLHLEQWSRARFLLARRSVAAAVAAASAMHINKQVFDLSCSLRVKNLRSATDVLMLYIVRTKDKGSLYPEKRGKEGRLSGQRLSRQDGSGFVVLSFS